LIIVHEFGHFIIAKKIGVRVEKFSLGFGPQLLVRKKDDTEYTISAIPLGGYVKLAGDTAEEYKGNNYEYLAQPIGRRFWIIFFGPLLNYVLGLLLFWLIFFSGYPALSTRVGGLLDGFGAKKAGLKVGDQITAVDGRKVSYWEELQAIVQSKRECAVVRLLILRDSQEQAIDVDIKEKKLEDGLGQKRSVGLLGVMPTDEIIEVRYGLFKSLTLALKKTWMLTALTYKSLWRIITGRLSIRESVTGPLGIFYITSKAASLGLRAVLHLIAVLSVSLAIFNVLPLPVLDGGHILFLAVEKIRGKALGVKAERVITHTGLTLIITLALIVTYNDVAKFFGDKILKLIAR
jgi:regulator of sigma E protease